VRKTNLLVSDTAVTPLPPHVYMKCTENATTLHSAAKSAFGLRQKVAGLPKLPPELELVIFEMCALDSPEVCTVLVRVAKRVYAWSVDTTRIIKLAALLTKSLGSILS